MTWKGKASHQLLIIKLYAKAEYCTISINSANTWPSHVFEKSQKIGKIEKKLFSGSEKNGCDAWRLNWSKWYSIQADPGTTDGTWGSFASPPCPHLVSTTTTILHDDGPHHWPTNDNHHLHGHDMAMIMTSVLPGPALAWPEAALACWNPGPSQSRQSWLGFGLARPKPRLLAQTVVSWIFFIDVNKLVHNKIYYTESQ